MLGGLRSGLLANLCWKVCGTAGTTSKSFFLGGGRGPGSCFLIIFYLQELKKIKNGCSQWCHHCVHRERWHEAEGFTAAADSTCGEAQGGGEPCQVSPETHNLPILNPCKSLNTLKWNEMWKKKGICFSGCIHVTVLSRKPSTWMISARISIPLGAPKGEVKCGAVYTAHTGLCGGKLRSISKNQLDFLYADTSCFSLKTMAISCPPGWFAFSELSQFVFRQSHGNMIYFFFQDKFWNS